MKCKWCGISFPKDIMVRLLRNQNIVCEKCGVSQRDESLSKDEKVSSLRKLLFH